MLSSKGQISAEIIIAVIVMLILFVIVLANNFAMESSSSDVASSINDKKECIRFAYLISQVYSSGDGSTASFDLENSATIYSTQKTITINQESCYFLAPTSNYSFSKGKLTLFNVDGNILMVMQ